MAARVKQTAHFGIHPTSDAATLSDLMFKKYGIRCSLDPVDDTRYSLVRSTEEVYIGENRICEMQAFVDGFRSYRHHCG